MSEVIVCYFSGMAVGFIIGWVLAESRPDVPEDRSK
jgi:uncharacterized membrane protein SpoIIM required for sporulation